MSAQRTNSAVNAPNARVPPAKPTKHQLLLQLLEYETDTLGDIGNASVTENITDDETPDSIDAVINIEEKRPVTRPKKQLTDKQLDALKKGQEKRDENRSRNKLEKEKKEEEEKRIIEEKLVKKAISIKKKQIKKQALLDEISDDEEPADIPLSVGHRPQAELRSRVVQNQPITRPKEVVKPPLNPTASGIAPKPSIRFV